jgi:hypothetical protein
MLGRRDRCKAPEAAHADRQRLLRPSQDLCGAAQKGLSLPSKGVDLGDDSGPKSESHSRTRAACVAQLSQCMLAGLGGAVLCDQQKRCLAWRFHIVRNESCPRINVLRSNHQRRPITYRPNEQPDRERGKTNRETERAQFCDDAVTARPRQLAQMGSRDSRHLPADQPSKPHPSARSPPIGDRFMTTNPHCSRCSTRHRATIAHIISAASCFRLRPLNRNPIARRRRATVSRDRLIRVG